MRCVSPRFPMRPSALEVAAGCWFARVLLTLLSARLEGRVGHAGRAIQAWCTHLSRSPHGIEIRINKAPLWREH